MKKAQVQMTETIAVLFVFFVLVFFGLIFYYQYSLSEIKEKTKELIAKKAIDTTTKTLFMPEVLCSNGEANADSYCLDVMKLRSLPEIVEKNIGDYYFDLFSFAKITVQEVYPDASKNWTIYDRPLKEFTHKEPTYFVVSLRDDLAGQSGVSAYGYGYVVVEVYS